VFHSTALREWCTDSWKSFGEYIILICLVYYFVLLITDACDSLSSRKIACMICVELIIFGRRRGAPREKPFLSKS
jgi:hypothetical protein